ncbi:NADH dehydrogenase [ubiquinone] 1 beta subcomplex subunit 5, mitochondrial-like [Littorina saxatilis]|uniref:NADH dehydrogenase [ubiquinone] 1 beta subcomplex subunit 5, mitochondrial n=1 Tax=Littorina saxatilis TaxID=31220 RepID=A0AAN9G3Q4_9CAEN
MVAMSLLRPALGPGARAFLLRAGVIAGRNQLASPPVSTGVIRKMGSNRMQVLPSRFEWERWKNDIHFYLFLGFAPMGLLIMYCNLVTGQAELTDVPEDYEPMPWEYYKGPIERWFARYIYEYPEKRYERTLHVLWEEGERVKVRKLEKKVRALMHDRQDYKGWYYTPVDKSRIDAAHKAQKSWQEDRTGTRIP